MSTTRIFMLCVAIVFMGKVLMYEQSDYIVTTERALISDCDYKNVDAQVKFFKFNRTYTALNISFIAKHDFGNDVVAHVQTYKFLSNEYRHFPMDFSRNVCTTLANNEFGTQNMYSCGNFRGCPIKKGGYLLCNWGPDFSKFPPYIPIGQYKLELSSTHLSEKLFTFEWYIKVVSTKLF